jgi:hypothetical protein
MRTSISHQVKSALLFVTSSMLCIPNSQLQLHGIHNISGEGDRLCFSEEQLCPLMWGGEVDWARMVNKPQWMVQFNNASQVYSQNVHITWRDALENVHLV